MIKNWYQKSGAFAFIRSFSVYFEDTTAAFMSDGLNRLTNLQLLQLDFHQAKKIDDETMTSISKSLAKLSGLQTVIISAKEMTKLTDTGIAYLCSALSYLQNLN